MKPTRRMVRKRLLVVIPNLPLLLHSNVDRGDGEHECWLWTGGLSDGYGRIQLPDLERAGICNTAASIHRLAYALEHGSAPDFPGPDVMHLCENKNCFNPRHLWPGTRSMNLYLARMAKKFKIGGKYGRWLRSFGYFEYWSGWRPWLPEWKHFHD